MKNKKIRVFLNGKYLREIYPFATRVEVWKYRVRRFFFRLFKWSLGAAVVTGAIYGAFITGQYATASNTIVIPVIAPVMERIAQAESHNSHFCTDNLIKAGMCRASEKGQVLVKANVNGTVDVGKYQINVFYWGAEATRQQLNIFDEKDNEAMALWIYKNKGTGEWAASQAQWRK